MLIWILALFLFLLLGYVGWCLGAIRLGVSLIGVVIAAILSPVLGHFFNPILGMVSVKNPVLLWLLGPACAYVVIYIAFNVIGILAHQKVDVYYKYKAGDLRMGLFNRLNQRLGVCVGVANAAVYLILISWVIYVFSYWTIQTVTTDNVPWLTRMLNTTGKNLQSSGMVKVAGAIDSMPESYYQLADVIGLIYHNDLLEGRLSRYPGFLAMAEQPEFQDIGNDKAFTELRQKQPPISEILDYPKAQTILDNPDKLQNVWSVVKPNLPDLQAYLKTGQSAKYDGEKILGRWDFDMNGALGILKRTRLNLSGPEMARLRLMVNLTFAKTSFVATPEPDKLAILKEFGKVHPPTKPNQPPTVETQSYKGNWTADGDKYQLTLPDKGQSSLEAVVDGDKLTITGDTFPMVFQRE